MSRSGWNVGPVGLKTRSKGHFSIKPCSHSRGHSFASAFMKLYQSFFNDILIKSEYGSCRVKNQVTRLDFFKTFFNLWTLQFFLQSSWNFTRIFALMISYSNNHHESCSKYLPWWFLSHVWDYVTRVKKLVQRTKSKTKNNSALETSFLK